MSLDSAVLAHYLQLPDSPLRTSLADQRLARQLFDRGVPLTTVEAALLLGSLRRLARPEDLPPLQPIRSLAYFMPLVDELLRQDELKDAMRPRRGVVHGGRGGGALRHAGVDGDETLVGVADVLALQALDEGAALWVVPHATARV